MRFFAYLRDQIKGWSLVEPSAQGVFTPGAMPSITYVNRDHLGLEDELRQALIDRNGFTVVSGPSKCGKSVLCKKVLNRKKLVRIDGGQIDTVQSFWSSVAYHLGVGHSWTQSTTNQTSLQGSGGFTFGKPLVASANIGTQASIGTQTGEVVSFNVVLAIECVKRLKKKDIGLLIEDFHYIGSAAQRDIVRSLKSAVFDGLSVILLAVPHRSFDPADVEGEVEGRLYNVSVPSWSEDDLVNIIDKGCSALQIDIPSPVRRKIAEDAFGSPLLVQDICRKACDLAKSRDWDVASISNSELAQVYEKVTEVNGLSRYDRMNNNLGQSGELEVIDLRGGGQEQLAIALLSAVARLGPKPVTTYSEIRESFEAISRSQPPSLERAGHLFRAIASALSKSHAPPFEWLDAREELALLDPFLMFYMRWVLRDRRKLVLGTRAVDVAIRIQARSSLGRKDVSE